MNRSSLVRRRLTFVRNALLGLFAVTMLTALFPSTTRAAAVPGDAGVDTSLPPTDSTLSVRGRDGYSGLEITVNQSRNLVNQALSVTWTGGVPTLQGPGRFGSNYMQIMQCWGEDDGSIPGNPGPPPEQCVQGASAATFGGVPGGLFPGGFALTRVISRTDWANFDPAVGVVDTRTTNVWRGFRAVDGTMVGAHTDPTFNPAVQGGNFWQNPYFNIVTTNEIPGAVTDATGKGAELFQVATGVESSGLGCGQKVEPAAGGTLKIPKCWLVVVPRSTPAVENVGTPFEENASQFGVATSPLAPEAWTHRIAIPLEFNPVDSPCSIDARDRRIVGSELVVAAMNSWQPALCSTPDAPPYIFGTIADASARQQILAPTAGSPGMAITPRPLTEPDDPQNPTVYAPVTLSGVVIGFNVERNPKPTGPAGEQALAGVRVADINLTPRLVAKLLTQSYRSQVEIFSDPGYPWATTNALHLGVDPDFLRFNPEFELLDIASAKNFGGLLLPSRNSDSAYQVWKWILADPEARAWMDGQPDEWGMKVNPVYATTAAANPAGVPFADVVPESFPKSDPYCYSAGPLPGTGLVPPSLCGTDWLPYTQGMLDAARLTRAADDGAKVAKDVFALSTDQIWKRDLPQFLGRRSILSVTDTASAALFGLQAAHLSRAGDDGGDRRFVAADTPGLTAGVSAMAADTVPSVLEPDPQVDVADAYPLTSLTYAAIRPLDLDDEARAEYADFLDYATGAGQEAGLQLGELPPGYAPLSPELRAQASAAATTVRELVAPPVEETPAPPPVSSSPSSFGSSGAGSSNYAGTTSSGASRSSSSSGSQPLADPVAIAAVVDTAEAPASLGPLTPILALARSRFVIPALAALACIATLIALEITKRPRHVTGPAPGAPTGEVAS